MTVTVSSLTTQIDVTTTLMFSAPEEGSQFYPIFGFQYMGSFTNDVIQKSPFFTPSPLRHRPSSRLNPPSEQKMTSSWPDPPRTLIFFKFMLFKIDKPAQKIAYEELSTTEKMNSDLTAVGLSDVHTKGNKN